MKKFSDRAIASSVSAIKQISALAQSQPDIINLSQGIPSFSTPEYIRNGVSEALLADEPGIGKYSMYMGTPELRGLLAEKLKKEWKIPVDAKDNLFVTAGAVEGLLAALLALINPGDEVILPSPDYGPHFQHVQFCGGVAVTVPLQEDENWRWDMTAVEKAVTAKTKMIVITNPGNPVGNVFLEDELEKLAQIAKTHDLWVVVDETYSFLTYDDIPFVAAATISLFEDRLVVVRSFSKEYAMTGWRLGYVYAASAVIKEALKMHDPMVIAASTISQRAGCIALQGDRRDVHAMIGEFQQRRDMLFQLMQSLSPKFSVIQPEGSYYMFVHVLPELMRKYGPTSEKFALRMLQEARVAVVPGSEFRPQKDEYIRFSFAGEIDMMKEAIRRISSWLK